jgi:hypothetical protein
LTGTDFAVSHFKNIHRTYFYTLFTSGTFLRHRRFGLKAIVYLLSYKKINEAQHILAVLNRSVYDTQKSLVDSTKDFFKTLPYNKHMHESSNLNSNIILFIKFLWSWWVPVPSQNVSTIQANHAAGHKSGLFYQKQYCFHNIRKLAQTSQWRMIQQGLF